MGGGDYSVYSADLAHDVRNDITRLHMHVATHHAEGNLHMRQVFLVRVIRWWLGKGLQDVGWNGGGGGKLHQRQTH